MERVLTFSSCRYWRVAEISLAFVAERTLACRLETSSAPVNRQQRVDAARVGVRHESGASVFFATVHQLIPFATATGRKIGKAKRFVKRIWQAASPQASLEKVRSDPKLMPSPVKQRQVRASRLGTTRVRRSAAGAATSRSWRTPGTISSDSGIGVARTRARKLASHRWLDRSSFLSATDSRCLAPSPSSG